MKSNVSLLKKSCFLKLTNLYAKPLFISLLFHFCFLLIFITLYLFSDKNNSTRVEFEVYQKSVPNQIAPIEETKPMIQPKKNLSEISKPRAVFGANRNSLTSNAKDSEDNTIKIKTGNTISKEFDNEILKDEDPTTLPNPTDEYLVTSMPILLSEIRIPYPKEAREASKEGPVILELLIDAEGNVRNVELISGPGYGLNEAAMEAVRGIKFRPAKIDQQSVAVKIRYTYRFVLETR